MNSFVLFKKLFNLTLIIQESIGNSGDSAGSARLPNDMTTVDSVLAVVVFLTNVAGSLLIDNPKRPNRAVAIANVFAIR